MTPFALQVGNEFQSAQARPASRQNQSHAARQPQRRDPFSRLDPFGSRLHFIALASPNSASDRPLAFVRIAMEPRLVMPC